MRKWNKKLFRFTHYAVPEPAPDGMNLPILQGSIDERFHFQIRVLQDDIRHGAQEEDL